MALAPQPDGSPASRRSTPSRSTPNGIRRVNGFNSTFREPVRASPSRQALEDYGKVFASEQRSLKRSLDDQTSAQQAKHIKALDASLREHERIRESAERELEVIRLENEREQRRRAELESQKIEDARRRLEQQKADERRRRAEDQRERQEEERRREESRKQQEEDARKRAIEQTQREQEARVKKQQQEKAEADRKAREEAEAKERDRQAQKEREEAALQNAATAMQPNGVASSTSTAAASSSVPPALPGGLPRSLVSTSNEIMAEHQKYLQLHKRLKTMRQQVLDGVKALGKDQKAQLTEWRQSIKRAMGMLRKTDDSQTKRDNQEKLKQISGYLDQAARTTQPMIDITQYIIDDKSPPNSSTEGPAQLLYLLNYFAKGIVQQILAEVEADPEMGNPIGILAVTVFARPNYLFNGQSLIDLLWAKYHKRCPALFGICADESTAQGRFRMGWDRNGELLPAEQHYHAVRALSVGFVNITLRSFAKSQNQNPAPNRIFWQAMARTLNLPSDQVQPTHFELLKTIAEHCSPRIIGTYGGAALALIRQAVVVFPAKHEQRMRDTPVNRSTWTALSSLPHILRQKYQLSV